MDALQYSSCTPEDDDDLFFLVFDDEPTPQEQCYILRRIIEDSSSSFLTELSHRIDNIDGNVLQWLRDEMQHVPIEI